MQCTDLEWVAGEEGHVVWMGTSEGVVCGLKMGHVVHVVELSRLIGINRGEQGKVFDPEKVELTLRDRQRATFLQDAGAEAPN